MRQTWAKIHVPSSMFSDLMLIDVLIYPKLLVCKMEITPSMKNYLTTLITIIEAREYRGLRHTL